MTTIKLKLRKWTTQEIHFLWSTKRTLQKCCSPMCYRFFDQHFLGFELRVYPSSSLVVLPRIKITSSRACTHIHTHTYIYIYIWASERARVCVYVCVHIWYMCVLMNSFIRNFFFFWPHLRWNISYVTKIPTN